MSHRKGKMDGNCLFPWPFYIVSLLEGNSYTPGV